MWTNDVRVALVGAWHVHANDYAGDCGRNPHANLVAVWDDDETRRTAAAEKWNVPAVPELDQILNDPEIDGVIVTTATSEHRDVMLKLIASGKHIFTEKVLAATPVEAEEIANAAHEAGVVLTVSLPRLYVGYTKTIKQILDAGELGDVSYVRVRVSHDGAIRRDGKSQWLPEHFFDRDVAMGGAMIDFGAHPYYLVHHFAGLPETISANYLSTSGHDVEDQALVVCAYPGRLTGVAEASFLGGSIGHWVEIHGSDGSLLQDAEHGVRTRLRGENDWTTRKTLPDDPTPFDRWISHVQAGEPDPENVAVALALTRMADAAERSAAAGHPVMVSESA